LDEADYHLLDRQFKPPSCLGVFALSATTVSKEYGCEEACLSQQGFYIQDAGIAPSFDRDT
jgi:hypothetical protein